jgi:hypothetical protein
MMFLTLASQQDSEWRRVWRGGSQPLIRILVLVPIAALAVAMALAAATGVTEDSISAYHDGPYRDVFVGGLVGVAIGLVAYLGITPLEDHALTLAGFYALFVAIVPSQIGDAGQSVAIIVFGYLLAVGGLITINLRNRTWPLGLLLKDWPSSDVPKLVGKWLGVATAVVFAGYVIWALVNLAGWPIFNFAGMHMAAAVLLFVHLWCAIAAQGFGWMTTDTSCPGTGSRRLYRTLAVLMPVVIVGVMVLFVVTHWRGQILWVEIAGILIFLIYWISEYWRTRGEPDSYGLR